jgi:metal-dependent amidase/aminoacylase/carboxypeptidase family protein
VIGVRRCHLLYRIGDLPTFVQDFCGGRRCRRVRELVEGIARGSGGSAEVDFDRRVPVLMSNPTLVKRMLPAVERAVGAANVNPSPPAMAADDFAFIAQVAPAFFFTLGTQKPGTTSGINHATNFAAYDSAIPAGIRAMTEVLLEYLRTTPLQ